MNDEDIYGDSDPGNLPDEADAGADAASDPAPGDGAGGYALSSHPQWRAGAFGSGGGVLGLIKVSAPAGPQSRAGAEPDGSWPGPHGGVPFRARTAPSYAKGPFDWAGMAREVDWRGVAADLAKLGLGVALGVRGAVGEIPGMGAAGSGALPNPWFTGGSLAWKGGKTLYGQHRANSGPDGQGGRPGALDRASNGLP